MAISHRGAGSAVTLTADAKIHVADDANLDVIQLTIEMRITPASTPQSPYNWLLDTTRSLSSCELEARSGAGSGLRIAFSVGSVAGGSRASRRLEGRLDREPLRHW